MASNLIIFDCDGVLVNSERLGNQVLADLLATYGCQVSGSELERRFRGMKLEVYLDILANEAGIELPESFEADLRQRMSLVYKAELQAVRGARRLVESLRVPFCVASSGPRRKIEENLKTTKLYGYFVGNIFSAYECDSWKPDPGLFLAAARHFGVAPKDCIVVEDSLAGVTAGIAADMTVLALNPTDDSCLLAAASRMFQSLDEIYEFFVSQNLSRQM